MKLMIEIPEYEGSVRTEWEDPFILKTAMHSGEFLLQGDRNGLLSLARHLLFLANQDVPVGCHVHYDDGNSLEPNSIPFVIDKIDA